MKISHITFKLKRGGGGREEGRGKGCMKMGKNTSLDFSCILKKVLTNIHVAIVMLV